MSSTIFPRRPAEVQLGWLYNLDIEHINITKGEKLLAPRWADIIFIDHVNSELFSKHPVRQPVHGLLA